MNTRQLIAVASATVLIGATLSQAQTRVDRSGANDANMRVGSNGQNSVSNRPNPWEVSNSVVYGTVTGGKQFRGDSQSTDPAAFRNTTANLNQDRFVRDSSGVTTSGVTSFNASQTRTYYGDSRAVPPPPGYVGISSTGGYTPPAPVQWHTFDPRLQTVSATESLNIPSNAVNSSNRPTFSSGPDGLPDSSRLGGPQQQLNPAALSDYTNLSQTNFSSQLNNDQLIRLRREVGQGDTALDENGNPVDASPAGALLNAGPQTSLDNGRVNDRVNGGVIKAQAVDASLQTQQTPEPGLVTKLTTPGEKPTTPDEPASDAKPLRPGQAAAEASAQYNAQLRARKAEEQKKADENAPADQNRTQKSPSDKSPQAPGAEAAPGGPKGPLSIGAIAGSTRAKGLNELLTKAEGQMREGKFASAIDTYESAESVAPHNGLIQLGLVNAELGGSYYRRAEATLRQIPPAEQRVLGGRYDLRSFIGDERLQLAQKDLADLVQKNPNDTGAAILLAYLYYNTANERRALALLDVADKRASGNDALVTFLKKNWTPGTDAK